LAIILFGWNITVSLGLTSIKMTHKKKGQLTTYVEWAKHLRKYWKKMFWRGERNAAKKMIKGELKD
jgi:hypothetical protein